MPVLETQSDRGFEFLHPEFEQRIPETVDIEEEASIGTHLGIYFDGPVIVPVPPVALDSLRQSRVIQHVDREGVIIPVLVELPADFHGRSVVQTHLIELVVQCTKPTTRFATLRPRHHFLLCLFLNDQFFFAHDWVR